MKKKKGGNEFIFLIFGLCFVGAWIAIALVTSSNSGSGNNIGIKIGVFVAGFIGLVLLIGLIISVIDFIKWKKFDKNAKIIEAQVFEVVGVGKKAYVINADKNIYVAYKISVNVRGEHGEINLLELKTTYTEPETQMICKKGVVSVKVWKNMCDLCETFTKDDIVNPEEDYIARYFQQDIYTHKNKSNLSK